MEWQEDIELICPKCGSVMSSVEGLDMKVKRCSGCGQTMAFEREPTQEEFQRVVQKMAFEAAVAAPFGVVMSHAIEPQEQQEIKDRVDHAKTLMRTMSQSALHPSLN